MAVTKRLVAIDDDTLKAAQAELGTRTLKDTVNAALKRVAETRQELLDQRIQTLAGMPPHDRGDAWR